LAALAISCPLPALAEPSSVVVTRRDEPIYRSPSTSAPRRGAGARGAALPVFGSSAGPGCAGRFLMVGPLAWICDEGTAPSAVPAPTTSPHFEQVPDGLPFRYYFVGSDGSFGYHDLTTAEEGEPDAQLFPGFGIAVLRTGKHLTDPFGLTTHGLWVPLRDLRPVIAPEFHGLELDGAFDVLWVVEDDAPLFSKPQRRKPGSKLPRLSPLRSLEQRQLNHELWHRVGDDEWVRDKDVRGPRSAPPPEELRPNERWIDVDLERQVLTAYQGERAVFATLVSTGRGAEGSEQFTPRGVHRVWVKLHQSDMDNLENLEARENYAIQAVPWVMYFERGYGLHGTFWHRAFGRVQSHGCVNLTPRDAKRLFDWSSPKLPAGWSAAFPTEYEAGTIVRVR
jgi:hypothetical protein